MNSFPNKIQIFNTSFSETLYFCLIPLKNGTNKFFLCHFCPVLSRKNGTVKYLFYFISDRGIGLLLISKSPLFIWVTGFFILCKTKYRQVFTSNNSVSKTGSIKNFQEFLAIFGSNELLKNWVESVKINESKLHASPEEAIDPSWGMAKIREFYCHIPLKALLSLSFIN